MRTPVGIRILHVDDEPDFAEVTAEMLERDDDRFTVDTVTTARDGLEYLADHGCDCIVSDYEMPGMDGIEFLEAVRAEYPDLPFILFTGKGSEEVASKALDKGATNYLRKRGGTEQYELLANRIQNAVEQYRASERAANLARIRTLVNDVNQALVRAETQDEIETVTCEILTDSDPYETAWLGDVEDDRIVPREGAGVPGDSLDAVSVSADSVDLTPTGDAVRDRDVTVLEVDSEPSSAVPPDIDCQSMATVPLVYDTTRFGVLVVYADDVNAFDEAERSLLVELGDDIAHALHSIRTQAELERRNDLFRKAQDIADVGAWEYTIKTDELRWTAEVYEIHDLPKDTAVTPEEAIEFYHPDDRTAIREAFHGAIEQGDSYDVELRLITADDDDRWVQTRGEPQFEDGELVRIRGTIQDITEYKEREQQLQEVLDRYEALFANTNDAVARIEYEDGIPIIQEANNAFRELFAPPGEDVVGRDLDEVVASEERFEEAREYSRTTADGRFMSAELTRDTVDGPRDFRWQAVPLDESSDPEDGLEAYAVYTDITERKERERELELYRTMVETVPDAVYALDEDLHYIAVNSAMTELTGYSKSELVGSHLSLVVDEDPVETAKENRRKLLESDADVLTHEYAHRTADGEEIPVENRFRLLPSDDGFRGTAGVIRDISHRKERERQVRQQREQLEQREEKLIDLRDYTQELMYAETLAETASIALSAIDEILGFDLGAVFTQSETQEGVLELVEVLNRSRMEKMYGGLPAFLRDAPDGTHSALAWEVFESGEPVFINDTADSERLTRKSPFGSLMIYPIGGHGIVLLAATRMEAFSETEEILLDLLATALETAFDRLEREQDLRRQRDALERQNERLEQFANVVSHDLRNPLNVATARVELAREECESTHLADVRTALDRMDTLITDLLTVAREGKQVEETATVSLSEIGETCWATVRTDAATLAIESERAIQADPNRLKQLLENLMRNAVEHGGQDVSITIGDLPDGFYVADDGPGIPADDRESVFEAGYSTTEDGTGFGLAIVQEIADAHDWEIRVTESDTGGARFEITGVEIEG